MIEAAWSVSSRGSGTNGSLFDLDDYDVDGTRSVTVSAGDDSDCNRSCVDFLNGNNMSAFAALMCVIPHELRYLLDHFSVPIRMAAFGSVDCEPPRKETYSLQLRPQEVLFSSSPRGQRTAACAPRLGRPLPPEQSGSYRADLKSMVLKSRWKDNVVLPSDNQDPGLCGNPPATADTTQDYCGSHTEARE